jgi:hypothetical protein
MHQDVACQDFICFESDCGHEICYLLKVLESFNFFLGGKKCRKDRAAQFFLFSGTILRGLTQPLNTYGYKYFSLLLLLFYPFVVPADLSQQEKSAAADCLNCFSFNFLTRPCTVVRVVVSN